MPRKLENAEVWKPKYGNGSMERKCGGEKKAVYWRLVPYWLTTVPSRRARRLFFSLPYFCFHTSLHFSVFHLFSDAQFTCSYRSLGIYESTGLHSKHVEGEGVTAMMSEVTSQYRFVTLQNQQNRKRESGNQQNWNLITWCIWSTILQNCKLP